MPTKPVDLLIETAITKNTVNKSRKGYDGTPEQGTWMTYVGSLEDLMQDHILKGHGLAQTLFMKGHRESETSYGGNLMVLDIDDAGCDYEKILATDFYKQYCLGLYSSCSAFNVGPKNGHDGRFRCRILVLLGRSKKTDFYELAPGEHISLDRVHLEHTAIGNWLKDRFCEQMGLPKLQDTCNLTVSQMFYGNSGEGTIVDGDVSYPCSSPVIWHINNSYLPAEDIDLIVGLYRQEHPEIFEVRMLRSDEERDRDYLLAQWMLQNDLFDHDDLINREVAEKQIGAACASISLDLCEDYLAMMSVVDDGHPWRQEHTLRASFLRFKEDTRMTLGTLRMYASQGTPGWEARCPLLNGSGQRKHFVPPQSPGFNGLKSTNPINIII